MKTVIFLIGQAFIIINCYSRQAPVPEYTNEPAVLETGLGSLKGTLTIPSKPGKVPVVLIISGSGPTDRDGNNAMMKNNSLKYLAEDLGSNGMATLRYDKRGVGESRDAAIPESELRFGTFVRDAEGWAEQIKNDPRFGNVYILGHSEGSLIGMLVAQKIQVQGFISVAGAGQPADRLILEQLKSQPDSIYRMAAPIIRDLQEGKTVPEIPKILYSIFRPSVQPYLISWFHLDPANEISRLTIPCLIIQGNHDLQVQVADAEKLSAAVQNAKLEIIGGMNHILKHAEADRMKNLMTYNNPDLPVMQELIDKIVNFIKS